MASNKKFLPPSPPQPPPPTPPTKSESMDRPLVVRIPLRPMRLNNEGEGGSVGGCEKVIALRSCGSKSPLSPHRRLPEYGRLHEGGASGRREMELPCGSLVGSAGRDEAAVQQHGHHHLLLSCEAYGLLCDAARDGLVVVAAEPFECPDSPLKF